MYTYPGDDLLANSDKLLSSYHNDPNNVFTTPSKSPSTSTPPTPNPSNPDDPNNPQASPRTIQEQALQRVLNVLEHTERELQASLNSHSPTPKLDPLMSYPSAAAFASLTTSKHAILTASSRTNPSRSHINSNNSNNSTSNSGQNSGQSGQNSEGGSGLPIGSGFDEGYEEVSDVLVRGSESPGHHTFYNSQNSDKNNPNNPNNSHKDYLDAGELGRQEEQGRPDNPDNPDNLDNPDNPLITESR